MRHVLVIRPDRSAAAMAARLCGEGFDAIACPVSRIEPCDVEIPSVYEGIIVTSPHALHGGIAARLAKDKPVFCVGKRAADAAEEAGLRVMFCAADSNGLVQHLCSQVPKAHFLYLSGADIHADLAQAGISVTRAVTYNAVALTSLPDAVLAALRADAPCTALMTSARSSRIFAGLLKQHGIDGSSIRGVAMSPSVAAATEAAGIACPIIADAPNEEALVAALRISC